MVLAWCWRGVGLVLAPTRYTVLDLWDDANSLGNMASVPY